MLLNRGIEDGTTEESILSNVQAVKELGSFRDFIGRTFLCCAQDVVTQCRIVLQQHIGSSSGQIRLQQMTVNTKCIAHGIAYAILQRIDSRRLRIDSSLCCTTNSIESAFNKRCGRVVCQTNTSADNVAHCGTDTGNNPSLRLALKRRNHLTDTTHCRCVFVGLAKQQVSLLFEDRIDLTQTRHSFSSSRVLLHHLCSFRHCQFVGLCKLFRGQTFFADGLFQHGVVNVVQIGKHFSNSGRRLLSRFDTERWILLHHI